jgi:hypothetical protein
MAELTPTALRFASLTQAVDFICRQIEAGDPTALTSIMSGLHPTILWTTPVTSNSQSFPNSKRVRRRVACAPLHGARVPD